MEIPIIKIRHFHNQENLYQEKEFLYCFTNVSRALQNNPEKIYNSRNHIYHENFKLKLCMCAQSMALGTGTNFQLEILISMISAMHKFWEYFGELTEY